MIMTVVLELVMVKDVVALAAGRLPMALSLHPFNAGLLLIASQLLLTKIEGQATRAAVKASALSSASKMLGTVP